PRGVSVPSRLRDGFRKAAPVRPNGAEYLVILVRDQDLLRKLDDHGSAQLLERHSRESRRIAKLKRIIHLGIRGGACSVHIFVRLPDFFAERGKRDFLAALAVDQIVVRAMRLYSVPPPSGRLPGSRDVVARGWGGLQGFGRPIERRNRHLASPPVDVIAGAV